MCVAKVDNYYKHDLKETGKIIGLGSVCRVKNCDQGLEHAAETTIQYCNWIYSTTCTSQLKGGWLSSSSNANSFITVIEKHKPLILPSGSTIIGLRNSSVSCLSPLASYRPLITWQFQKNLNTKMSNCFKRGGLWLWLSMSDGLLMLPIVEINYSPIK